jgi:type 2 lantibiotic biosynthesis protein LanM
MGTFYMYEKNIRHLELVYARFENATPIPTLERSFESPLCSPIAAWAAAALSKFAKGISLEVDGALERQVSTLLLERASTLSTRYLIMELHAQSSTSFKGREYTLAQFTSDLSAPGAAFRTLVKYPELGKTLWERTLRWLRHAMRILVRFQQDQSTLLSEGLILKSASNVIFGLQLFCGDDHEQSQSVARLEYQAGKSVYYRPHPAPWYRVLKDIIACLASNSAAEYFPEVPLTLERVQYAWVAESVVAPCETVHQVRNFYRRIGGAAAIFHALGSSDMHGSNIVAHNEYPVLIDLETLFTVPLNAELASRQGNVVSTAIFPQQPFHTSLIVDTSALGSSELQVRQGHRMFVPTTGGLVAEQERTISIKCPRTKAILDGAECEPREFLPEILDGFRTTYRALQACRSEIFALISAQGHIATRVVLRPTQVYAMILDNLHHPKYLSGLLADKHIYSLRQLTRSWVHNSLEDEVLECESRELVAGSIPRFTATLEQTGLSMDGLPIKSSMISRPPLEALDNRLKALDEGDCFRQMWLISASIQVGQSPLDSGQPFAAQFEDSRVSLDGDDVFLIGRKKLLESCVDRRRLEWMSVVHAPDGQYIAPVNDDLYRGRAGIFYSLAHTLRRGNDRASQELIEEIAAHLIGESKHAPAFTGKGVLDGPLGAPYSLWQSGIELGRKEWLSAALKLFEANQTGEVSKSWDLLSGYCGYATIFYQLYTFTEDKKFLTKAQEAMTYLQEHRQEIFEYSQTGLAHGLSGLVLACWHADVAENDDRFATLRHSALELEDALVLKRKSLAANLNDFAVTNWWSWCNGLLGSLAVRAVTRQTDAGGIYSSWLAECYNGLFLQNQGLCHGSAGTISLLPMISQAYQRGSSATITCRAAVRALADDLRDSRLRLSTSPNGYIPEPGAMVGLAGVLLALEEHSVHSHHPASKLLLLQLSDPTQNLRVDELSAASCESSKRSTFTASK